MTDPTDEQLDLFAEPPPTRPICAPCGNPAKWRIKSRDWARYCGGSACVSPTRICKNPECRKTFDRDSGGTRYCEPACRESHHNSVTRWPTAVCPVDGTEHEGKNRWHLCGDCFATIRPVVRALEDHHVPADMVVGLIKDPYCPFCRRPMLEYSGPRGRLATTVDHDHAHHPGPKGCDLCVRGLVCWKCNATMGNADDDADRLEDMARYLRGWHDRP